MCFHFEVSHLQGIIYIFSREHKAFLLLSVTYQIGFIVDTMTITAIGTLRITTGEAFHRSTLYSPDLPRIYLVFLRILLNHLIDR